MSAPLSDADWIIEQLDALTVEMHVITPSEWAETKRYLPPSVTSLPGYFRFDVNPYMREIVDCFGAESPVREVALMKGVQVTATTAVLENAIGYAIEHVKTAPVLMVTADGDLAQIRMEAYVRPMIAHSGLGHLIRSSDATNNRKTGNTDAKLEWIGGGFLLPMGAQNANKMRSFSAQYVLRDEIDGWPLVVGKDGDPIQLTADRAAAYEASRKIGDFSTPGLAGSSKIKKRFDLGDQRYYFVPCLACGHMQRLRWTHTDEHGVISGMVWELDADGFLIQDSVRYLCEACQHPHTNDDKTRMMDPANGAEWRPTAKPIHPYFRSYHLSALYSPVGMQTWPVCVQKWLEAWDVENNMVRDIPKLQVFYNNVLGEVFVQRGQKLRFEDVSTHRRHAYRFGEVPNKWALEKCGSPVLALTCAVDVHGDNLAVAVWGWTRERRALLVDYWRFEGATDHLDTPETWGRLRRLIEEKVYEADDGKRYRVAMTLIDSGFLPDTVHAFTADYAHSVYAIRGRQLPPKTSKVPEFSQFTNPMGNTSFNITVDLYKDRWSSALRRSWDGVGQLGAGMLSAPIDVSDKQLKELTVETKREKIDSATGQRVGFVWHRPSGADNELWDLLVYGSAAFDMLAWDVCRNQLGLEAVNWQAFYAMCETQRIYYS